VPRQSRRLPQEELGAVLALFDFYGYTDGLSGQQEIRNDFGIFGTGSFGVELYKILNATCCELDGVFAESGRVFAHFVRSERGLLARLQMQNSISTPH
jgi:hypothetical protein